MTKAHQGFKSQRSKQHFLLTDSKPFILVNNIIQYSNILH